MPLTAQGKAVAIAALHKRRKQFQGQPPFRNESLPAGSPMYFACIGCGAPICVPEGYFTKPDTCGECSALLILGWMTE